MRRRSPCLIWNRIEDFPWLSKKRGGPVAPMSRDFSSPSHWLQRAAQTRAKAERSRGSATRARLIKMAEQYDQLAEQAERQLEDQSESRPIRT